jgi:hypothetical protein
MANEKNVSGKLSPCIAYRRDKDREVAILAQAMTFPSLYLTIEQQKLVTSSLEYIENDTRQPYHVAVTVQKNGQ